LSTSNDWWLLSIWRFVGWPFLVLLLWFDPDMQPGHPAGKWELFDGREAGPGHEPGNFFGGGGVYDGIGQIFIGRRICRKGPGDERYDPINVYMMQSSEELVSGDRHLKNHDLPLGYDYPVHLSQQPDSVRDVPDTEGDGSHVEGIRREGQLCESVFWPLQLPDQPFR